MSLNSSSEQDELNAWSTQFIENWIQQNQDRQFTCRVTPIEVTPPGTEADSSSIREGLQQGLGAGATLMSAAAGLATVGQTFGELSRVGMFGVGGIVASSALSVITPFLFPDPAPPPPTTQELIQESQTEIYTQMNMKVAELQACVDASAGSTLTLAGQLSHDLARMAAAMGNTASIRAALIDLAGLNDEHNILIKGNIVSDKCSAQVEEFRVSYGSNRIVVPYLMTSMRMCFGFYVGWALAEFQLIQEGQATDQRYTDVMTMMMGSMNRFEQWFDGVPNNGDQLQEYKRSVAQTKVLTGFLQHCLHRGQTCKWFEPKPFYREIADENDFNIKQNGWSVRDSNWHAALGHDAELRCFRCANVSTGIGWIDEGPDVFFRHHMWYNYNSHPAIAAGSWEGGGVQSISPVYICGYGAPEYYTAQTLQARNEVFDQAGQRCGNSQVPWLYWRTQLENPALMEQAIVERKADRASKISKIAEMPLGCQKFATTCTQGQPGHASAQPWLASWSDLSAAVTLCCMAGFHTEIFCSKLAEELLDHHEQGPNVTLTAPLCNELEELTNIQENWENQPSALVQASSREARLAQMSHYLAKVHHKAGSLMQYLGGAALVTSLSLLAGASTSGALVSALTAALVSNVQGCCEDACETLTVQPTWQCACWLPGGGWEENTYVGPPR